jgi:hypothetical protein
MAETVYEMMMHIGLHGGAMSGLQAISRELRSIHLKTGELETGIAKLGPAFALVAGALGAGLVVGAIVDIMKKTEALSDQLVKLKNQGGEIAAAVASGEQLKRSYEIARSTGMKVEDVMALSSINYSLMGQEKSLAIWEDSARFTRAMQFQKGYKGEPTADYQRIMKAGLDTGRLTGEDGRIDEKRVKQWEDLSIRIINATHGMVDPANLKAMAQQSGFTLRNMTAQGIESMAIMAQVMGGARAGTAFIGLYQQMARGQMTKKTALGMEAAGLLKPDEWQSTKTGIVLTPEASQRLTKLIDKDPMNFAANLDEYFKAHGITDPEERARLSMGLTGRQTTQRFVGEMIANRQQMLEERDRMGGGAGVDETLANINKGSITSNLDALANAWHNLENAVAGPNSENFIKVVQSLTWALGALFETAAKHPEIVKDPPGNFMKGLAAGPAAGTPGAVPFALGAAGAGAGWTVLKGWWNELFATPPNAGALQPGAIPGYDPHDPAVPKKESFFGNGITGPRGAEAAVIPANFEPGSKPMRVLQPVVFNLNIDGHQLGQTMVDILQDLSEHATSSPNSNGQGLFSRADGGLSTS